MNFSRSALFHTKTKVCLKYLVNGCNLNRKSSPKVRSSRQQMFFKTGVPKHIVNFTGKHRY